MFTDKARNHVARCKAAMHSVCQNVAAHMETRAKQIAPWKDRTAHARESINSGVEVRGEQFVLFVAHGVRYGRYLEQGTEPHVILPRHKKALYWAGAPHPVKKVKHPGTDKYPAILPAAEAGRQELKNTLRVLWGV